MTQYYEIIYSEIPDYTGQILPEDMWDDIDEESSDDPELTEPANGRNMYHVHIKGSCNTVCKIDFDPRRLRLAPCPSSSEYIPAYSLPRLS